MVGAREQEENIVRRLLTTIDQDAAVSQRKLSEEIGIAVGSVNWYLKRCVTKGRSEEHTSELQSLRHLVCRLLLEKKKKKTRHTTKKQTAQTEQNAQHQEKRRLTDLLHTNQTRHNHSRSSRCERMAHRPITTRPPD